MNQPRLFGARNHAGADSGLFRDGFQELAAVLRLARCARGDGDGLVDAVRVGEASELRHHLQGGVYSLRRQCAAVESAGAKPHHFFLSIDDFERQIGADAHDDHVQGVGADIDGGEAHGVFYYNGRERSPINTMSARARRSDLLRKRLEQFTRLLHELGEGDVRALHRTRVASRRLREILPVLQLKTDISSRLSRRLKHVTEELGRVRELDVLQGLVAEMRDSGRYDAQALRRVSVALGTEQSQARGKLEERLPIGELHRIGRKLEKVGDDLRRRKPSKGWRWAVDARVTRRADTLVHTLDDAGAIYLQERLHDVRIALKKFRYALEISSEASGVRLGSEARTLKKAQDILGRLHDLQVLIDRVRQIQPVVALPDLTTWKKMDGLVNALENDCRRLHAKFVHRQGQVRAICERVARADAGGSVKRAVAS
jgi:CHAD domain-containing protein